MSLVSLRQLYSATAAHGTTTQSSTVSLPHMVRGMQFTLVAADPSGDAEDTLDVYVQTRVGETWVDTVHFSQVLGNGGAKTYVEKILASASEAGFETGTALSEGEVRNLMGEVYRVRTVVADANASSTFAITVGVTAC